MYPINRRILLLAPHSNLKPLESLTSFLCILGTLVLIPKMHENEVRLSSAQRLDSDLVRLASFLGTLGLGVRIQYA